MPADPVSAGRKGGQSRSEAKRAAARRNGFQKPGPANAQPQDLQPGCGCTTPPAPASRPSVLIVPRPEGQ